ncbi:transcription-repair coupling factor [Heliorestis acidaminivorans]|uniref:Transcription-repair-coupling factor n=1 Tax=Heliorestis acidaminivorans TaxID=553427 RepID=A0A6I0F1H2_9FIRM|nr:transcription-repair coupling factor [Heliorestis acidaminivorans]KAB2953037.1 transcription-repair coupling factor [Heliorestis acidaminivorans]
MIQELLRGNLFDYMTETAEFQRLWSLWAGRTKALSVVGLSASQRTLLMASMGRKSGRPLFVITHSPYQAKKIMEDLQTFLPDEEILFFPATEVMPYEVLSASHELSAQRLTVLTRLARKEPITVVTTIEALQKKLVPPFVMERNLLSFACGQSTSVETLVTEIHGLGYERVPLVERRGQFSLRGGILDIFPLNQEAPARIEFFDDEVDTIRIFDLDSQRSQEKVESYEVGPARELLMSAEVRQAGQERLAEETAKAKERLLKNKQQEAAARLQEKMDSYVAQLQAGIWVEGMEQFQNFFYPDQVTLLDYLHPESLLFWDEPMRLEESAEAKRKEIEETFVHLLASGGVLPIQQENYLTYQDIMAQLKEKALFFLSLLPKKIAGVALEDTLHFTMKLMHSYMGKMNMLAEELTAFRQRKYTIMLLAATKARQNHIKQVLRDYGVESNAVDRIDGPLEPATVIVAVGSIESGLELPQSKLVLITDSEIFGREKKARKTKKSQEGAKIDSFLDLSVGDYVVHVNHGIGRYVGVEKLVVAGFHKDYLVIKYAGEDRLYVPTEQVHLIQKYVGSEGVSPKIYRLGGNDWQKVKNKVKESVREMAGELLKLYAARESLQGIAFSPDTTWQKEFEESFVYEETPDQLRSIEEVKKDMENHKPMDRLLCGDVGYGKTEVAIRAAFKAVCDNKQVAILVPTTILAQQHYNTFRERFRNYPEIQVEMLSRFRSSKEQKETIEGLRIGTVDVVIGTHRLVSSDIRFKDLGLLIIDEEQRFGVAHKEKIKQLRTNVDVLTLSATPIPRTLHMSLVGLRDMSTIETPPEDRYPVQTYVVEYNFDMIREAIRREIGRGGQVYYVRNRVEDLERIVRDLSKLVPEARVALAHGKMREDQLEQIMMDFLGGEYDILVCTTIIETGLDVPNVNTLIVDGADLMGLSQLYQLRGRVGRSNRLAYAYFTYRKDKVLTEVAEKRLHAIREFTELGSGFKIAMRDLEIRGVGNLLGPEQHGQMASVGFDLYCRLLEESIQELRGEKKEEEPEVFLELKVDAFIPDNYVSDSASKVQIYKRLLAMKTLEELDSLEDELIDRYGDLPDPVHNLVLLSKVKVRGNKVAVTSIQQSKDELAIRFLPHARLGGSAIMEVLKLERKVNFSNGGYEMIVKTTAMTGREILKYLEKLLDVLQKGAQKTEKVEASLATTAIVTKAMPKTNTSLRVWPPPR